VRPFSRGKDGIVWPLSPASLKWMSFLVAYLECFAHIVIALAIDFGGAYLLNQSHSTVCCYGANCLQPSRDRCCMLGVDDNNPPPINANGVPLICKLLLRGH